MINFGRYNLLSTAQQPLGTPALWSATTYNHITVLAKAYAWQITGTASYRDAVIAACAAVIGTEIDPATSARASSLTIARQLMAYITSAEIVVLPEPLRTTFKAWLAGTLTVVNSEGRSLVTSNTIKASEWGTFAGAALIAAYRYLGNTAGIASVANVLRGWLGDRTAYTGFSYDSGATPWFPNPSLPVGVLPVGATLTIAGTARNVDGCIPVGLRYYTPAYPFPQTDDPYYALQGVIAQAVQLAEIAGYEEVWEWSDQAIRRAFAWQIEQAGYLAVEDDAGMLHVVNAAYGTSYQAPAIARVGKIDAFYDYRFAAQIPFAEPDFTTLARGLWIDRERLPTLPRTGPAWQAMYDRAMVDPWPTPSLWSHGAMGDTYAVAGALVSVATDNTLLRDRVIAWCLSCVGSEIDPTTGLRPGSLPLSRNLFGVLVAADLVEMKAHLSTAQRTAFDAWLRATIYTVNSEGRSMVMSNYTRPNNWGLMAASSLLAAFWWLEDAESFQAVAGIFKGYLGDRSTYAGFTYKYDFSWHADENAMRGINPRGSVKLWDNPYDPTMEGQYVSIDGVLPEEMRRWDGVAFIFPPPQEQYCWEALQGAMATAEVLTRAGYPAWQWEDRAIARAVNWIYTAPVSYNNTVWLMGAANYPPTVFTNYDDDGARGQPVVLRYKNLSGAQVTATLTLDASDSSTPVTGTVPCRELISIEIAWTAEDEDHILRVYAGALECGAVESPLAPGVHVSRTGYPADGDDLWQVWLANYRLGTSYQTTTPTTPGKQIGFTDWTHIPVPDVPLRLYPESDYAALATGAQALTGYVSQWSVTPGATWRTVDILVSDRYPLAVKQSAAIGGVVEAAATPETIGWWLHYALGPGVTVAQSNRWRHTYTPGRPLSFCAERCYKEDGTIERLLGLCVSSLTLDLQAGGIARVSASLMGAKQVLDTMPICAVPRADGHTEWVGHQVSVQCGQSTCACVSSAQITIDNRLSNTPFALLGKPCKPALGRVNITALMQMVVTDLDWLRRAIAGTLETITLTMTNDAGVLTLTMSDCLVQPVSPSAAAGDTETRVDLSVIVGGLSAVLVNDLESVLP